MGFEPHNLLAFRISASWGETADASRVERRMVRTLETLRAIPGVESAAIALGLPKEEKDSPSNSPSPAATRKAKSCSPTRSSSLGLFPYHARPVLSGETCNANYDAKAPSVALVNRAFADRFFPARAAGTLHRDRRPSRIIGVVGDVRQHGASHDPCDDLLLRHPALLSRPEYIVRSAADPMLIADAIRRQVRSIEPNRAVYELTRVTDALADSDSAAAFRRCC